MHMPTIKEMLYALGICCGILLLVSIYRHNRLIRLSHQEQRAHQELLELNAEKKALIAEQKKIYPHAEIYHYAKNQLGFKPIKKNQIITMHD